MNYKKRPKLGVSSEVSESLSNRLALNPEERQKFMKEPANYVKELSDTNVQELKNLSEEELDFVNAAMAIQKDPGYSIMADVGYAAEALLVAVAVAIAIVGPVFVVAVHPTPGSDRY